MDEEQAFINIDRRNKYRNEGQGRVLELVLREKLVQGQRYKILDGFIEFRREIWLSEFLGELKYMIFELSYQCFGCLEQLS